MNKTVFKNSFFVYVMAILCCALWGISTPIVKLGYNYVDSSSVPSLLLWLGIEFVIGGIFVLFSYGITTKKSIFPKKQNVGGVIVISMFQTVLQYVFMYIGLLHTTAVKGAIIKSTDVFVIMLISSLIFRQESLTIRKALSCIIGFAGIVVMNLNGLKLNINPLGDGLVFLAIVFYSFSVAFTKKYTQTERPIVLSGFQMLLGGLVVTVMGIVTKGKIEFINMFPIIIVLSLIYAVSYSLWTILLKYNPALKVTIFSFTTPIFGVVFSALLLKENSGVEFLNIIIALILVSTGIILWSKSQK